MTQCVRKIAWCFLFTAAALTLVAPVQAASVTTDVDINLPSILILFCYDEIDVTITAANLATLMVGGAATGDDAATTALGTTTPAVVGTNLEGTVITLSSALNVNEDAVFLNLLEVCGIRAIGNGNGVDVSVALTANTTLANTTGAGSILIDQAQTRANGGGAFAATYNIPDASLGLGNLNLVDVQLELDLTSASEAGDYSSAVDGTFTITAVAP